MKQSLQVILFDLDDTLYPRETGVMYQVGRRIEAYLSQKMGLASEQSTDLRRRYWQEYGTTLNGLVLEYGVDPEDYLAFVHDIPLDQLLHPDPQLDRMLTSIPQRKVIFTNATQEHANRVLNRLGVTRHFERTIDVRSINFLSKKAVKAHRRALDLLGVAGSDCMLIEDIAHNLKPAKSLGVVTVLIGTPEQCPNGIDFCIPSVLGVGDVLRAWEARP